MYFSFSGKANGKENTIQDYDNAQSGHGGTMTNSRGGFSNRSAGFGGTSQKAKSGIDENGYFYVSSNGKKYVVRDGKLVEA